MGDMLSDVRLLLLALLCVFSSNVCAYELAGRVDRVSDGDTFLMISELGVPYKIRLLHIDSPERGKPYYKKAKLMLKALIANKSVSVKCTWIDGFNRHLCSVFSDGVDVNREMVRIGGAFLSKKYYNRADDSAHLVDDETAAKKARLGLWGATEYMHVAP